jgi:hypothetical protein
MCFRTSAWRRDSSSWSVHTNSITSTGRSFKSTPIPSVLCFSTWGAMCCCNSWGSRFRPRVASWWEVGAVLECQTLVHTLTAVFVQQVLLVFNTCLNCSWWCSSVSSVGIDLSHTQKRWSGVTWGRALSNSLETLLCDVCRSARWCERRQLRCTWWNDPLLRPSHTQIFSLSWPLDHRIIPGVIHRIHHHTDQCWQHRHTQMVWTVTKTVTLNNDGVSY